MFLFVLVGKKKFIFGTWMYTQIAHLFLYKSVLFIYLSLFCQAKKICVITYSPKLSQIGPKNTR